MCLLWVWQHKSHSLPNILTEKMNENNSSSLLCVHIFFFFFPLLSVSFRSNGYRALTDEHINFISLRFFFLPLRNEECFFSLLVLFLNSFFLLDFAVYRRDNFDVLWFLFLLLENSWWNVNGHMMQNILLSFSFPPFVYLLSFWSFLFSLFCFYFSCFCFFLFFDLEITFYDDSRIKLFDLNSANKIFWREAEKLNFSRNNAMKISFSLIFIVLTNLFIFHIHFGNGKIIFMLDDEKKRGNMCVDSYSR